MCVMIDECLFDYTRKPRQLYSLLTALQSSWTQLLSGKPAPLLIQDEDMPNSFRNETARSVVEHRQHVRALHFLPSVSAGTGSLCRVGGGLMWRESVVHGGEGGGGQRRRKDILEQTYSGTGLPRRSRPLASCMPCREWRRSAWLA